MCVFGQVQESAAETERDVDTKAGYGSSLSVMSANQLIESSEASYSADETSLKLVLVDNDEQQQSSSVLTSYRSLLQPPHQSGTSVKMLPHYFVLKISRF